MLVSDFDYPLPEERIAQHPAPRGEGRLLVLDATDEDRHRRVRELPELLRPDDLLVVNDTRVLPARLFAQRATTGARVELLLAERISPVEWDVLVRPGRRARPGERLRLGDGLEAEVVAKGEDGRHRLRFSEPVESHLERLGHVPLPPYIKRPDDAADRETYQTIFARRPGAIAAPTAGLHFTPEIVAALGARGIALAALTLHVGLGTFKPVTARLVHEHRMDSERFEISRATERAVRRARDTGGRVVAVGTTVVRALEGSALLSGGQPLAGRGSTALFIAPGFRFQVVDALVTNFHLPRSTLLMLVCAFAGRERVLAAYAEAVEREYRFYSYGDAMLAERRR